MSRHNGNVEGAFPLLLLGSVLLVYAAITANQELTSKGSHLPLWGLIAGVGGVIVGAGIYSTFLEPTLPPTPAPAKDWVTVAGTDWESLPRARRAAPSKPARSAPPDWWEGPPIATPEPEFKTEMARSASRAPRRPTPGAEPWAESDLVDQHLRPIPPTRARYSTKELNDLLDELEALVEKDMAPSPRGRPKSGPTDAFFCADCERTLVAGARPDPCDGCGRSLCPECARSSRSEDGQVLCILCRVRAS